MKTAITSTEKGTSSQFDLRFGRAAWFCVYDDETGKTEFYKNENAEASHGAGPKAGEKMAELGVSRVISGDFGPKAKDILDKLSIQMIIIEDEQNTVQGIIEKIRNS